MDTRVVQVRRSGEPNEVTEEHTVVVFPDGVPVAQVGVEVNRSVEIAHNHWFGCRVTETRNVVQSEAAMKKTREEVYADVCAFIDEKLQGALEEV